MKVSIITLFPEVFPKILDFSILGRAQKKQFFQYELINLRDFGEGNHKTVDDKPYGGGVGMLLKANVLAACLKSLDFKKAKVILTSASGTPYTQSHAKKLSEFDHLILICGHYEGVDQRFIEKYVDEEISIGNYVLTGGELPAMVIIDSMIRLIPGVLEKEAATQNESFSFSPSDESLEKNLLEYPQYTRPENFEGMRVPEILLSGNHKKIEEWRKMKSIEKTKK